MLIKFKCAHCGTNVKIDEQHAGKKAKCPSCSHTVQIPTLDQAKASQPPSNQPSSPNPTQFAETAAFPSEAKSTPSAQPEEQLSTPSLTVPTKDDQPFNPFQSPGEIDEPALTSVHYGGFWRRVGAMFIDRFVLSLVALAMNLVLSFATQLIAAFPEGSQALLFVFSIMGLSLNWLYFAVMESSSKQATLGKMALGMKVVDEEGGRIGFGRATGRYFAKIISTILLLYGFWRVAFEPRKRGLHDSIAGTFVVLE